MGATTFMTRSRGGSAKEAFRDAVEEARWEEGNGGYTGTIAEKDSFVMITNDSDIPDNEYANMLINNEDPRVDDKWGPAGCIKADDGSYLFFGWASC